MTQPDGNPVERTRDGMEGPVERPAPPPRTPDTAGFWDDPVTGKSYCYTCERERDEHDFGEFLAHLLDEPLEVGRAIQGRVVKRLESML